MAYKSDIEIAQEAKIQDIRLIAGKLGLTEEDLDLYGKYKAKIDYRFLEKDKKKNAQLVLVTAMNPTPAGEGKTTTTIGIADALSKIGKNTIVALREPSLGPVFGMKGGATGAAMRKWFLWKRLICTLPEICMPLALPTICLPLWWITIFFTGTKKTSISGALLGAERWI